MSLAVRSVFCKNCGRRATVDLAGELPSVCLGCGMTGWWRADGEPAVPYELTLNDKRFLRSLRITPEDDLMTSNDVAGDDGA